MHKEAISQINEDIKRTKRAIISLGCSFVRGHGAIDDSIYRNYTYNVTKGSGVVTWDTKNVQSLVKEFPDIKITFQGTLDFYLNEEKNAFVNVLAKKYFEGSYASINLGISGSGNRATIKELYFYPAINWKEIDEIIVIYCPTGAERFDFIDDQYHRLNDHARWISSWPRISKDRNPVDLLWQGYAEAVHSSKYEIIEQIAHIQELLLWCEHKNAKLIIVPSFSKHYNRENFIGSISQQIDRDNNRKIVKEPEYLDSNYQSAVELADMWPWDKMFYPDGHATFIDLIVRQEFPHEKTLPWFFTFAGVGSPNMWVTPCCHPSAKAHDLFAKYLHDHILKTINE
jgi:hypothetical protein